MSAPADDDASEGHVHGSVAALTLGALGVVYGDIGTSPLYALKECLSPHYGLHPDPTTVLGLLSLMFWSLTMVVTVKYLCFIMRADNRGEGGILALLALCPSSLRAAAPGRLRVVTLLVIVGAALLYGDGMITPAISVLSAVEGLEVATTSLRPAILPITCVILFGVFWIQKHGTARVGRLFGPVMVVWFLTLGVLGAIQVVKHPAVLAALSPHHAAGFLTHHGFAGFAVLGSVVLCVTGGEALYADMGHFGKRPIRMAWLFVAMPALVLAYFGQGALVLADPAAAANPFFAMVPRGPLTYALVALAAAATIIASQALISGAFSLTHQAVQLGLFPRVTVTHTSADAHGQIYVKEINWGIAAACLALVLIFQSSSRLAAAYGLAVCGTMVITTFVFFRVARERWKWPLTKALPLLLLFMFFDAGFLSSNLLKFKDGGYVPVVIAGVIAVAMVIWSMGRSYLAEYMAERSPSWKDYKAMLDSEKVHRTESLGVFMASDARGVPPMMVHVAERMHVMPGTSMLLTIRFDHVPYVRVSERISEVTDLGDGFWRVVAHFGFMQQPDVPRLAHVAARRIGADCRDEDITYYLGRETFLATSAGKMGPLTEGIFQFLSRNARTATAYFRLPAEQVVELGVQIDL
jgi:KUP system potassium uptake protein